MPITTKDFTTQIEVDPNARITVVDGTQITTSALTRDESAYVYSLEGVHFFAGARIRFNTKATAGANSGGSARVGCCGVSEDIASFDAWTQGVMCAWVYNGSYLLQLVNFDGTSDVTAALSIDTLYYVELRTYAHIAKMFIYSDAGYTTLVDTLTITNRNEYDHERYLYSLISEDVNIAGATLSIEVNDMDVYDFEIDAYTSISEWITADSNEDMETAVPPSGWTEESTGTASITQSTDWAKTGSNSAKIIGVGADDAGMYKGITAGDKELWVAIAHGQINAITDGDKARMFYVEDTVSGNIAAAVVNRSGSVYTWAIETFNGSTWTNTAGDTDIAIALDTDYNMKLIFEDTAGTDEGITLWVNGVIVVEVAGTIFTGNPPNRMGIGSDDTQADGESTRYIDDWTFHKQAMPFFANMDTAVNGDIGVAIKYAGAHALSRDDLMRTVTTSNGGITFENETTIDIANRSEGFATGIVTHNGASYNFVGVSEGVNIVYGDEMSETDPNSRINVATDVNKAIFSSLDRDETAYLIRDDGAGNTKWDGDFIAHVDCRMDSGGNDFAQVGVWGIMNVVNDFGSALTANDDYLILKLVTNAGSVMNLVLQESDGGSATSDIFVGSLDTTYYCRVIRDESVGSFGTLTCEVYATNVLRATEGTKLDTLTITLNTSKKDFRYLYGLSSWNTGLSSTVMSGFAQNLDDGGYTFVSTNVYKSTNNMASWVDTGVSIENGLFIPSRTFDGTKILGGTHTTNSKQRSKSTARFVTYDTDGDTFDDVWEIAADGDVANRFPGEVYIYRRPSDGKLISFTNRAKWTGTIQYIIYQQVSDDDGATWNAATSMQPQWGYKAARHRFNVFGGFLWITLALRDENPSPIRHTTSIFQCDKETFDVIQEKRWYTGTKYQEDANGESIYGGRDPVTGDPILYVCVGSGDVSFYKFLLTQISGNVGKLVNSGLVNTERRLAS